MTGHRSDSRPLLGFFYLVTFTDVRRGRGSGVTSSAPDGCHHPLTAHP
jgi:hypothetical protein